MDETTAQVVDLPKIIIRPSKGWVPLRLKELWEYRELQYFLVWRDIKVRYKQTVLGAAWAIIQPFFTILLLLQPTFYADQLKHCSVNSLVRND